VRTGRKRRTVFHFRAAPPHSAMFSSIDTVTQDFRFLVFSFLDSATAVVLPGKRDRRLNMMVAQFFCLGAVDFLRQAEALEDSAFHALIKDTFERYKIPLNISVPEYLRKVSENVESTPSLEQAMVLGAEAFRRFWAAGDASAPLDLAKMIVSIDDLNDKYEALR